MPLFGEKKKNTRKTEKKTPPGFAFFHFGRAEHVCGAIDVGLTRGGFISVLQRGYRRITGLFASTRAPIWRRQSDCGREKFVFGQIGMCK